MGDCVRINPGSDDSMTTQEMEQWLEAVESEVAELKRQMAGGGRPGWLRRLRGSMKGMRGFPKMIELGKRIRHADRPVNED